MKLQAFFTASLLVGLAFTAPTSNNEEDTVLVTKEFFPSSLAVYNGSHDIVSIFYPLNAINFGEDNEINDDEDGSEHSYVFFVEADVKENGEKDYQGLYVLKNGVASKLLENGRDSCAGIDDTKTVYLAATDGLYTFNVETAKAEKYGTLTDNFIGIAKLNSSDDQIYALTSDNILYKVTEHGTKKEKIESVVKAKQIILDYSDNLFYSTTDNEVYVLVNGEVKKIEGLPQNPVSVTLLRPLFVLDNGIPLVIDNTSYIVNENGTVEKATFEFQVTPTAYSVEATLIHYYAYNKTIYKYNILELLFTEVVSEIKGFLEDKTDSIQSIASKSRSEMRA